MGLQQPLYVGSSLALVEGLGPCTEVHDAEMLALDQMAVTATAFSVAISIQHAHFFADSNTAVGSVFTDDQLRHGNVHTRSESTSLPS